MSPRHLFNAQEFHDSTADKHQTVHPQNFKLINLDSIDVLTVILPKEKVGASKAYPTPESQCDIPKIRS